MAACRKSLIVALALYAASARAQDDTPASTAADPAAAGAAAPEAVPPAEAVPETAPPAEAAPAPETAPAAAAPAAAAADDGSLPKLRVRGQRNPDLIFGDYRVRISVARPEFDDGLKFYDELYGKPSLYPTLSADWFAFDWYVTFGFSFRMGYYTADGYTAKVVQGKATSDIEEGDIEKDKNGPTNLTLIPLQLALTAEMTPFKKKWLVLDGWIGRERLYFQEVRSTKSDETTALIAEAEEDTDDDALTNKGWSGATVVGMSANILLNPIDERAANSMRGSMGLGYIYISPYVEYVRTQPKESGKISFGRTVMGVGFTFETTH